jgi:hypothetical protein
MVSMPNHSQKEGEILRLIQKKPAHPLRMPGFIVLIPTSGALLVPIEIIYKEAYQNLAQKNLQHFTR